MMTGTMNATGYRLYAPGMRESEKPVYEIIVQLSLSRRELRAKP